MTKTKFTDRPLSTYRETREHNLRDDKVRRDNGYTGIAAKETPEKRGK